MNQDLNQLLEWAKTFAHDAGAIMREYYALADKSIEIKQDKSPVTIADKKINQLLIDRVQAEFPEHGVLGEEDSLHPERQQLWVCDPIDGTAGFILGVPTAMLSLAYVVDGQTRVAVLYEPLLDKLFTASLGSGAFLNGEPIRVSHTTTLEGASIGLTASVKQMFIREKFCKALLDDGVFLNTVPGNVFKASLVAQGRMDGFIFPGRSAHDIAGEKLIIEEAGGKVTSLDGKEQRYDGPIRGAVVSNGHIHDALVAHITDFGVEDYLGF